MRMILRYMRKYAGSIVFVMVLKLAGAIAEMLLPYLMEHMIDEVVPLKDMSQILLWGCAMIFTAFLCWRLNVNSNGRAVENAHNVSYDVRRDLFDKTIRLSGTNFDRVGLASLTSRLTSDSYNIQSFVQSSQTMFVRAPFNLIGGIVITMTMDPVLSGILCLIVPILLVMVVCISRKGIPMYRKVQERLDDVVRIMRENITGIRVVKALTRERYETARYTEANERLTHQDVRTNTVMAIPGPMMQLFLNTGLTLVVFVGARRVNGGQIKPGVILAFLTYFNLILTSVMAINRLFMMVSKASASALRIDSVLKIEDDQRICTEEEAPPRPGADYITFEHVNFSYDAKASEVRRKKLTAHKREQCLYDINFSVKKGESLGIIGPTGCGKTTIVNLLMRFYDVEDGRVFIGGRDVRTYDKDELHSLFGTVFQNDLVFQDTLRDNIVFGRDVSEEQIEAAITDAMAKEYIDGLDGRLDYMAEIRGANLSGGQKQRLLVSRALVANPEILVLDDSSSALDYRTDAQLRKAIFEHHGNSTTIMIAQRVSSVMNMTNVMVMDDGRCIGYGKHEELLKNCAPYREIYETQMGAMIEFE